MSEEEKKAIEYLKENSIPILRYDNYGNILNPLYFGTEEKQTIINLIEKQQKIINQLLEDVKERANNFSYETEIMWRKIEKAEELLNELLELLEEK